MLPREWGIYFHSGWRKPDATRRNSIPVVLTPAHMAFKVLPDPSNLGFTQV